MCVCVCAFSFHSLSLCDSSDSLFGLFSLSLSLSPVFVSCPFFSFSLFTSFLLFSFYSLFNLTVSSLQLCVCVCSQRQAKSYCCCCCCLFVCLRTFVSDGWLVLRRKRRGGSSFSCRSCRLSNVCPPGSQSVDSCLVYCLFAYCLTNTRFLFSCVVLLPYCHVSNLISCRRLERRRSDWQRESRFSSNFECSSSFSFIPFFLH